MKPTIFILIDDDEFSNNIGKLYIKHTLPEIKIVDFVSPEAGLDYLNGAFKADDSSAVLLLDINMPSMTGWEFLDEYARFDDSVKSRTTIYILSSSVDKRDKDQAASNLYIKGYLEKPLERPVIKKIYESFSE
jgi:CheY-like chemotaxis protein